MIRVRLYVGTLPNGLPAADRDGFGIFRVMNDFGEMSPIHGVAYEPEVPKCATCARYTARESDGKQTLRHGWCKIGSHLRARVVPGDGSGYCHEHSDKPEKLSDVVRGPVSTVSFAREQEGEVNGVPWCHRCPDGECRGELKLNSCDIRTVVILTTGKSEKL